MIGRHAQFLFASVHVDPALIEFLLLGGVLPIHQTQQGKPLRVLVAVRAIPGKTVSAGPFYVVWLRPEAAGIRSEQWPHMVARVRSTEAPEHRWPELAVDAALPPDSPIRAGQALFFTQCMVCHTLNGAGNAHVGPDLNRPQNPADYLTPAALRQLIRNPASVRSWPAMQMPGFDQDAISDQEIDLIVQYLAHMAGRNKS